MARLTKALLLLAFLLGPLAACEYYRVDQQSGKKYEISEREYEALRNQE